MSGQDIKSFIGIDPSSTITGCAHIMDGKLVDWCRIKLKQSEDPIARCVQMGDVVSDWLSGKVEHHRYTKVAVEVPGNQTGASRGKGLITLGMACMSVILATRGWDMVTIPVTEWSKLDGVKAMSKVERAKRVIELHENYDVNEDQGLDVADAIGLAWYLEHV